MPTKICSLLRHMSTLNITVATILY
jgi:hypothetical protein